MCGLNLLVTRCGEAPSVKESLVGRKDWLCRLDTKERAEEEEEEISHHSSHVRLVR